MIRSTEMRSEIRRLMEIDCEYLPGSHQAQKMTSTPSPVPAAHESPVLHETATLRAASVLTLSAYPVPMERAGPSETARALSEPVYRVSPAATFLQTVEGRSAFEMDCASDTASYRVSLTLRAASVPTLTAHPVPMERAGPSDTARALSEPVYPVYPAATFLQTVEGRSAFEMDCASDTASYRVLPTLRAASVPTLTAHPVPMEIDAPSDTARASSEPVYSVYPAATFLQTVDARSAFVMDCPADTARSRLTPTLTEASVPTSIAHPVPMEMTLREASVPTLIAHPVPMEMDGPSDTARALSGAVSPVYPAGTVLQAVDGRSAFIGHLWYYLSSDSCVSFACDPGAKSMSILASPVSREVGDASSSYRQRWCSEPPQRSSGTSSRVSPSTSRTASAPTLINQPVPMEIDYPSNVARASSAPVSEVGSASSSDRKRWCSEPPQPSLESSSRVSPTLSPSDTARALSEPVSQTAATALQTVTSPRSSWLDRPSAFFDFNLSYCFLDNHSACPSSDSCVFFARDLGAKSMSKLASSVTTEAADASSSDRKRWYSEPLPPSV
jgi:hypothetical protein